MRRLALAALAAASIIGIQNYRAASSVACIHLPATYKGSITTDTQEGILFHDAGREALILKAAYRITGDSMPENFAWVLTVPSKPDNYSLASDKVFEDMFNWAEQYSPKVRNKSKGLEGNSLGIPVPQGHVIVEKKVEVGPYDIQPVRAVGKDAAAALNEWFKTNGYSEVKAEHLQYFIDGNMTFLCVKVVPKKVDVKGSTTGQLPPLQISFASEKPYYPMKFFAFQGDMKLRLYTLTRKELDFAASKDVLSNLKIEHSPYGQNHKVTSEQFPENLTKIVNDAKTELPSKSGAWYFNILDASGFNSKREILKWPSDVFLTLK